MYTYLHSHRSDLTCLLKGKIQTWVFSVYKLHNILFYFFIALFTCIQLHKIILWTIMNCTWNDIVKWKKAKKKGVTRGCIRNYANTLWAGMLHVFHRVTPWGGSAEGTGRGWWCSHRCRSQNNGREIRPARTPVMMRPRFIREFLFLTRARPTTVRLSSSPSPSLCTRVSFFAIIL